MRSTTDHLMALKRLAQPTPMMAAEMLCVVDTGIPSSDAKPMTEAELASAAKPLIGCSLTSLCPSVLMMRHPPTAVPEAMVSAHTTLIQVAMPNSLPGGGTGERRNSSQTGK